MRRPEGITLTALWFFFFSTLCVFGLGGLSIGLVSLWSDSDAHSIVFGTMGMMLGFLAITVTGTFYAVTGWGLWTLKSWSRGAAIILAALQIVFIPFGTVAGIMILIYLSRSRRAKEALGIL